MERSNGIEYYDSKGKGLLVKTSDSPSDIFATAPPNFKADTSNKTCRHCGVEFSTTLEFKIYCSDGCQRKNYRKLHPHHKKKGPFKKECVVCGSDFVSKQVNALCCSMACREILTKRKSKNPKTGWHGYRLRFFILSRDGFRCHYCGRSPMRNKDVELEIDHIIPKAKGGNNNIDNLITSCLECNQGKKDILLS